MHDQKDVKDYSYDRKKYGHILDYDRHSLIINGRRVFLFGGEFHYWRVPDRERWRDLLLSYKAGGLNSVRIYFHWGWHSPDEGKYVFTGNRDLHALFRLCEELGLYVLCAPGPYICAETSAGGFPAWLLAKRHIRLRHLKRTGVKKYDPEFARHSREWIEAFVSIMKDHELTTNPEGCVIGLQVENELFRKKIVRLGLDRHMEDLSREARSFGATVPLFHNDAMLFGSWVGGKDPGAASVDLYGFDSYIIWCPQQTRPEAGKAPRWKDKQFSRRIDTKEKEFRELGGWNLFTPFFVPELQGGWFNQWCLDHGFDEIYKFYGDDYTKAVVESFMAQSMSMFSMYMYYGGTNWGTLGDPDVYTSYDYSANIREYGYLSGRLRKLRMTRMLICSFEKEILESLAVEPMELTCNLSNVLIRHRRGPSGVDFYFLRNFHPNKETRFNVSFPDGMTAGGALRYRSSFIAVGHVRIPGFNLRLSTLPWLARMPVEEGELWVFQAGEGELLFDGAGYTAQGSAHSVAEEAATRVTFLRPGPARLRSRHGHMLYLLALEEKDAMTFTVDFQGEGPTEAAWGAYKLLFTGGTLEVETTEPSKVAYLGPHEPEGFQPVGNEVVPGLWTRRFESAPAASGEPLQLGAWAARPIQWNAAEWENMWKPIRLEQEKDPLDHLFTSGHVLYRCRFKSNVSALSLKLNTRHRATVWLNEKCVGGHVTYGLRVLKAGAKNGPDPACLGAKRYDLSPFLQKDRTNRLVILTESLGFNRGPGVLNDFRNPRGILKARFSTRVEDEHWEIAGIDVRTLEDVYNTTGLPGEDMGCHRGEGRGWMEVQGPPAPKPDDGLVWYRTTFSHEKKETVRKPLHVHLEGRHSVQIFVNGLYIGRYQGEMGPQHDFYVMDGVLRNGENTVALAVTTISRDPFTFRIRPYTIDPASGNLDPSGLVFCTTLETVPLSREPSGSNR